MQWVTKEGQVRFLGMEIRRTEEGYSLSQEGYAAEIVRAHAAENEYSVLPATKEWLTMEHEMPEIPTDAEGKALFDANVKDAQQRCGELLWLSQRTRPEISFPVAIVSSCTTRDPERAVKISKKLLAYINTTRSMGLFTGKSVQDDPRDLYAFTDASFAPEGRRSHGGAMVVWRNTVLCWKSWRHSTITLSSAEAEVISVTEGAQMMEAVRATLRDMQIFPHRCVLMIDSTAALAILGGENNSWRTRHLKLKCEWLRQKVKDEAITLFIVRVTKQVPGQRLKDIGEKWGLRCRSGPRVKAMRVPPTSSPHTSSPGTSPRTSSPGTSPPTSSNHTSSPPTSSPGTSTHTSSPGTSPPTSSPGTSPLTCSPSPSSGSPGTPPLSPPSFVSESPPTCSPHTSSPGTSTPTSSPGTSTHTSSPGTSTPTSSPPTSSPATSPPTSLPGTSPTTSSPSSSTRVRKMVVEHAVFYVDDVVVALRPMRWAEKEHVSTAATAAKPQPQATTRWVGVFRIVVLVVVMVKCCAGREEQGREEEDWQNPMRVEWELYFLGLVTLIAVLAVWECFRECLRRGARKLPKLRDLARRQQDGPLSKKECKELSELVNRGSWLGEKDHEKLTELVARFTRHDQGASCASRGPNRAAGQAREQKRGEDGAAGARSLREAAASSWEQSMGVRQERAAESSLGNETARSVARMEVGVQADLAMVRLVQTGEPIIRVREVCPPAFFLCDGGRTVHTDKQCWGLRNIPQHERRERELCQVCARDQGVPTQF